MLNVSGKFTFTATPCLTLNKNIGTIWKTHKQIVAGNNVEHGRSVMAHNNIYFTRANDGNRSIIFQSEAMIDSKQTNC